MGEEVRDTIPRLRQLVPHMRDQLLSLRAGATFESARLQYIDTVDRLATEGLGRRVASRVDESEAYWAPTGEVLDEGMRLGFIERQPLPSARSYLGDYRDRKYELTERGRAAADLAGRSPRDFYNELTCAASSTVCRWAGRSLRRRAPLSGTKAAGIGIANRDRAMCRRAHS